MAVATALLGLAQGVAPNASSAYVSCQTRPTVASGGFFDGYYYDTSTQNYYPQHQGFQGASAYIVNRYGSVCDSDQSSPNPSQNTTGTNVTTAWVMIANADPNTGGWSQTGFLRGYGSPQYEFDQEFDGARSVVNTFPYSPTLADGDKHAYRELYDAGCGCVFSSIDGVNFAYTHFNPYDRWSTYDGGFSPQFSGETTWLESNIPGVSYSRTEISALGTQFGSSRYTTGPLKDMPCALSPAGPSSARWSRNPTSCLAFTIWTNS